MSCASNIILNILLVVHIVTSLVIIDFSLPLADVPSCSELPDCDLL